MRATQLDNISVFEERRVGTSKTPMRTTYVSFDGLAPSNSALIYMVLDDECVVGEHTHSSEEVILCLEGDIIVVMNDESVEMQQGSLLMVPAGTRHALHNAHSGRARALGYFPNRSVATTFHVPLSADN